MGKTPVCLILPTAHYERERRIQDDYEWALNDPAVGKRHGGKVFVVHRRRVWGAGKDHGAACAAASRKRGCPPRADVAFVVVPERT
jgi:hypothetical protein